MFGSNKACAYIELVLRGISEAHKTVSRLNEEKKIWLVGYSNGEIRAKENLQGIILEQQKIYERLLRGANNFTKNISGQLSSADKEIRPAIVLANTMSLRSIPLIEKLIHEFQTQSGFFRDKHNPSGVAFIRASITQEYAIYLQLSQLAAQIHLALEQFRIVLAPNDPRAPNLDKSKAANILLAIIKVSIGSFVPDALENATGINELIDIVVDTAKIINPQILWGACKSIAGLVR